MGIRPFPKLKKNMKIDQISFSTGAAVGSAGSATATGYSIHVNGKIIAVYLSYQDSPPAGTTSIVLSDEADPSSESIITVANAATDVKIYPRRLLETNDGTDLTYDGTRKVYDHYVVNGRLEAIITGANADDYIDVTVWIET